MQPIQKKTEDEIKEQTSRIVKLFKRQLKISLVDMQATFEELKQFDPDSVNEEIIKDYHDSLNRLKDLENFENELVF